LSLAPGVRLGPCEITAPLGAGRPVELFDGPYTLDLLGHQRWDVAPDGRFLMVENSDDFRSVLVQSWSSELNRLAPRDAKRTPDGQPSGPSGR
jgi:hypothetical protein